jgi:hypothetical protein
MLWKKKPVSGCLEEKCEVDLLAKNSEHFNEMFSPLALRLAWERYTRSGQREAKDYHGIRAFGANLNHNLESLSKTLVAREYHPSRPPKYFKPKSSGMQRTITVLPVVDSLVFQSIANYTATIVFDKMAENNEFVFGSVLHEEVKDGLSVLNRSSAELFFFKPWQILYKEFADSVNKSVREAKVEFKFETDITGFYDNIPHYNLLTKTADMSGLEEDVLDLLAECLNTWSGTRDRATPGVGIPQATVSSHFFANLFLHDLDKLVRQQGLPYYRYMDDIRIYGYDHDDLQRVLIRIDRHLKQHALSLNAKKTTIEHIVPEKKEESVIIFEYDFESALVNGEVLASEHIDALEGFDIEEPAPNKGKASRRELIRLCYRDIREAKQRVSTLASPKSRKRVDFNDRAVQREFMNLGFRFRQAIRILRTLGRKPRIPKGKARKGWLYLAEHYFWLMNHFCWVLNLYEKDNTVKKEMLRLLQKYEYYEWTKSEAYQCLAMSQRFTAHELQLLYRRLELDESWFAKRSLYFLLLHHSHNQQFFRSVMARAIEEKDEPLRREILFMGRLWQERGLGLEELKEAFGLQ